MVGKDRKEYEPRGEQVRKGGSPPLVTKSIIVGVGSSGGKPPFLTYSLARCSSFRSMNSSWYLKPTRFLYLSSFASKKLNCKGPLVEAQSAMSTYSIN